MTSNARAREERPCWFVGAAFDRTEDQTERFVREGIWEAYVGHHSPYEDLVKSMQPGDRIAIKATSARQDPPFDYQGKSVSFMRIKAVGTVKENRGDGRKIAVDWTSGLLTPPRDWYFYTYFKTVWQVWPDSGRRPWAANALIRFTFDNEPQDIARFLEERGPGPLGSWDEFVERAREHVKGGKLEGEEITYKVETGRKLSKAREAVLAGVEGWAELLREALNPREANFLNWRQISNLNQWCATHPENALRALQALWTQEDLPVVERIGAFAELFPLSVTRGVGTRTNVASVLLMGLDVEQYPPFRVGVFTQAYANTGYGQPGRGVDEATSYEHALDFLDRFAEEAEKRGLSMRHRLDAQSLVWMVLTRGEEPPERVDAPLIPIDPWAPDMIHKLAEELLWETRYLQKIIDGLKDKRQAIFQGPPGTGKTYVAKRIAEWCKGYGGDFKIVQFHPSYSYEDFVEGFRPMLTKSDQAGYKLSRGPLRRIAAEAEAKPDATFILVIDEINRGNVAKVLGELYFLLEYRDEDVELQYSHERFSLPNNLWIIGTMNTTDRSIALVDAALRRRFYFFGFFPDEPPIKGLLDRWLEGNNPEAMWVGELVETANRRLEDRHLGIGPSHFMKGQPPLSEDRVRFIWEQAIIPYIEEQCFGNEEKLKEFGYDRLKRELEVTDSQASAVSVQMERVPNEDTE